MDWLYRVGWIWRWRAGRRLAHWLGAHWWLSMAPAPGMAAVHEFCPLCKQWQIRQIQPDDYC